MLLQPGDVVIIVKPNGRTFYWEQDTPEVLAYLDNVEALSTCACEHDQCPVEEMSDGWACTVCERAIEYGQSCLEHTNAQPYYRQGWRAQLANGQVERYRAVEDAVAKAERICELDKEG